MLQRFFRDAGILGITEIILRLKGLVLIPILTKAFGAVNYGIWAQVIVIVSILTPLIVIGTDSAAMRFLPGQNKEDLRRGFSSLLFYYVIAATLVSIALILLAEPLSTTFFEDKANARFVWLSGGVIFTGLITNLCRNFYRLIRNSKFYALINISQSLYTSAIALGVAIVTGTIYEVILLEIIADFILAIILLAHIIFHYGLTWPNGTLLIKFMRFGLPIVLAGYAMWVLNLADRLFITYYGTLEDLGVYNLVYSLGYMLINLIFNPIWLMYPPAAAELYNQGRLNDLSRLYRYSTRMVLSLMIPAVTGISILSIPLVRFIASNEFISGAPLIPLITIGYVLLMLANYYDISLALVGQQIWSTINMIIAAGLNILLNFLFIPIWGIAGAALATAISFGALFLLAWRRGSKQIPLEFDWPFLGKVCLASLGMAITLWFIPSEPAWMVLVNSTIGLLVFAGLLILMRAIQPAEWDKLLEMTHLNILKRNSVARVLLGLNR
jgi:O-antigen/teichoic acid export membrane protein